MSPHPKVFVFLQDDIFATGLYDVSIPPYEVAHLHGCVNALRSKQFELFRNSLFSVRCL